jgi:glutathione-regulated potassium-efflux system protein KefB
VLFGVAHHAGLLEGVLFQRAILVVALSMALTPLLVRYADRLLTAEKQAARSRPPSPDAIIDEAEAESPRPVLIAGFGRVGRRIGELLHSAGVPYVGIDQAVETVAQARARGFSVFFGDASRPDVLRAAGIARARLAIVATDRGTQAIEAVRTIRREAPKLPILVRAVDRAHCREMVAAGATRSFSENLETSLQLAAAALYEVGEKPETVQGLLNAFREEYAADTRQDGGSDPATVTTERS